MDNPLKNAIEEFKKLPTSGKIAVAGAIASIIALVVMTRGTGTSTATGNNGTDTSSSNPLASLGGNSGIGTVATAETPVTSTVAPITYPWESMATGYAPGVPATQPGTLGALLGMQAGQAFAATQNGSTGASIGTKLGQLFAQTPAPTASQIGILAGKAATIPIPVIPVSTPTASVIGSSAAKSIVSVISAPASTKAAAAPTYTPAAVNPIVAPVGTRRAIAV